MHPVPHNAEAILFIKYKSISMTCTHRTIWAEIIKALEKRFHKKSISRP